MANHRRAVLRDVNERFFFLWHFASLPPFDRSCAEQVLNGRPAFRRFQSRGTPRLSSIQVFI